MILVALTLTCALVSVTDGDTFRADCGAGVVKIRIADIDAPERKDCPVEWAAARDSLARLITGPLSITLDGTRSHDRVVADVAAGGIDLGRAMVISGHAKPWPHEPGRKTPPKPRGC